MITGNEVDTRRSRSVIQSTFYLPLLDQYLKASDIASDWSTKRYEYMMEGKAGKALFIDRHVLPDLRKTEHECLQKLIDALEERGYYAE